MRFLSRLWIHDSGRNIVARKFAADRVLGPETFEDLKILVHDLAALLERDADRVEFTAVPARSHAHQQSALREQIHAPELLGQDTRGAHRRHACAGARTDTRR